MFCFILDETIKRKKKEKPAQPFHWSLFVRPCKEILYSGISKAFKRTWYEKYPDSNISLLILSHLLSFLALKVFCHIASFQYHVKQTNLSRQQISTNSWCTRNFDNVFSTLVTNLISYLTADVDMCYSSQVFALCIFAEISYRKNLATRKSNKTLNRIFICPHVLGSN